MVAQHCEATELSDHTLQQYAMFMHYWSLSIRSTFSLVGRNSNKCKKTIKIADVYVGGGSTQTRVVGKITDMMHPYTVFS